MRYLRRGCTARVDADRPRRYCVCPGYVRSQTDGDRHYIGADMLMRLYRVAPADCLVLHVDRCRASELAAVVRAHPDMIYLQPRYRGDYNLPIK
jgi:hypothetical protein